MKRLAMIAILGLAAPAQAQNINCTDRDTIVTRLSGLGEVQSGLGLSNAGQVFEIWSSTATGSWTILLSHSSGMSCIMSHGLGWTGAAPETPGKPA